MLISLNWIQRHCSFKTNETPQKIGERFSLATAEVEGVMVRGDNLDRFVAARVLELDRIEGTDHLTKALVDDGSGERHTVVCGAPNVRVGMKAVFARPGTVVLGRKLKRAKIRGVESSGMLLAEDEMEISDSHEGLMELPDTVEPGTPIAGVFPGLADVVLEVDNKSLTHRPDLWGHHGVAREFATIYDAELRSYRVDEGLASSPGDPEVRVRIDGAGDARRLCRRYCGLRIDGVKIGPSPTWLQHLLLSVGSRPINNIVDITNYILFDLGQPLHAFDRERVCGGEIVVRMPRVDERLRLLDGREITLDADDLVIADAERAVALAGVMGGEDSEIVDSTVSIFLESANFDPVSVRRASIRHGRTESSARFEKSLDPEQARLGILRAAELVLEFCPEAKVVGPLQDVGFEPPEPIVIELSSDFISNRLGADLSLDRTRAILDGLGFEIDESQRDAADLGIATGATWHVTVPSWRATRDISVREDLVEEVGRIHGYGQITPQAPEWPVVAPQINERRVLERRIKEYLTFNGLTEVYTYSMVGAKHCQLFGLDPDAHMRLRNWMNEDMDRLRREIVPQHIEKASDNLRYYSAFRFFELGRVFRKDRDDLQSSELPTETTRIAGVVVCEEKSDANFYEVRSIVLGLVDFLQVEGCELKSLVEGSSTAPAWAHPNVGATLFVGGAPAGSFYRVHPHFTHTLELRGDVYAFDLDFEVLSGAPKRSVLYSPLPRYPGVPFDVAVLAGVRTPVGDLREVIRRAAGSLLQKVTVFDVYTGRGIDAEKKSVALQLEFRAEDHTLTPEEVESLQNRVIEALEGAGYPLRQ